MSDERNLMNVRENCLAATGASRARLAELFDERLDMNDVASAFEEGGERDA